MEEEVGAPIGSSPRWHSETDVVGREGSGQRRSQAGGSGKVGEERGGGMREGRRSIWVRQGAAAEACIGWR